MFKMIAVQNFHTYRQTMKFSKSNILLSILITLTCVQYGSSERTSSIQQADHAENTPNTDPVTLTLSTDHMKITAGMAESFKIASLKPVTNPVVVYLLSTDTHVATVHPSATILKGEKEVEVPVQTVYLGSCRIEVNYTTSDGDQRPSYNLLIHIDVRRSHTLSLLTGVLQWFYQFFFAVHLIPQLYLNYQRKSVVGLSFDYLILSVVTFGAFAAFNSMNYWSSEVRDKVFTEEPVPPEMDMIGKADVVVGYLNLVLITATFLQCYLFHYEKDDQKVSKISKAVIIIIKIVLLVLLICVLASNEKVLTWYTFVTILAGFKLVLSFIKYIPQVYMNYQRQSTVGWSIAFPVLDFLCGILLILQMFMLSFNYGHWVAFLQSPTRLGIAIFSIVFGIIFIVQHYKLYRLISEEDTIPIIGSEKMGNRSLQAEEGEDDERTLYGEELRPINRK